MLSTSPQETSEATLSRKTRSLSFVKGEDSSKSNGFKRTNSTSHGQPPQAISTSSLHLQRGLSMTMTSSLFSFKRANSNVALNSNAEDSVDTHTLLADYSRDMEVEFKGDIFSVSEFSQLSDVKKLFSLKKHEFGTWSKKTKICLEIGTRYVRETCIESGKVLAIILVQDMKFGLTKMGKRYQFTIQGLDHQRNIISRVYEVNTSSELNIWYTQLSEAKNGSGKSLPSAKSNDLFASSKTIVIDPNVRDESEEENEPVLIIPNHGYRFWVEFHAYVQKTRQSIEDIVEKSLSNTETYKIKEDLAELEYQVKGM